MSKEAPMSLERQFAVCVASIVILTSGAPELLLDAADAVDVQPRLVNAQVIERALTHGLEEEFRAVVAAQAAPAWTGYAVPMVPGEHRMCCSSDGHDSSGEWCGKCRLEEPRMSSFSQAKADRGSTPQHVSLESGRQILVLFRVEGKLAKKIRVFSEDCELDAGGLPVFWLKGVSPAESVANLSKFISGSFSTKHQGREEEDSSDSLGDGALSALAMHAGPEADQALEKFVSAGEPEGLREKASFWLGAARARRGYEILSRLVRQDPSDGVREKAVFALYVSKQPEAVGEIVRVARDDSSPHVRGQALFWLGQEAGQKAERAITEAIERDPETEVKKKAVFALSQLPKEEGVPLLIQVARANRNPSVRKQAMFWLGQSNDPRALAFFAEVLQK
jgi:hypothetical protein